MLKPMSKGKTIQVKDKYTSKWNTNDMMAVTAD